MPTATRIIIPPAFPRPFDTLNLLVDATTTGTAFDTPQAGLKLAFDTTREMGEPYSITGYPQSVLDTTLQIFENLPCPIPQDEDTARLALLTAAQTTEYCRDYECGPAEFVDRAERLLSRYHAHARRRLAVKTPHFLPVTNHIIHTINAAYKNYPKRFTYTDYAAARPTYYSRKGWEDPTGQPEWALAVRLNAAYHALAA